MTLNPAFGLSTSVSASSDASKILNVDSFSNSVWLVKIPTFIAEKWADCNTNDELGLLTITNTDKGKTILVNLKNDKNTNQPTEFVLEEFSNNDTAQQHLIVFDYENSDSVNSSAASNPSSYIVKGQITKKSILTPKNILSAEYKKIVSDRNIKANSLHETVIAPIYDLETRNSSSHTVDFIPPPATSAATELKRKVTQQQSESLRNVKANMNESTSISVNSNSLRGRFFDAFTNNARQSLKELLMHCSTTSVSAESGAAQEKDVKEMLDKYARYHSKGTYRGFWELKVEYQDRSSAAVARGST